MEKKEDTLNIWDTAFVLIVGSLIFIPIIWCGNNPGLYLDAVNPDYAAVQVLYPQQGNARWMFAWPYLTQAYHGNVGVLFSLLSILLTGTTSVLNHHMLNGVYCFVICILLYQILKQFKVSKFIAYGMVILLATTTSMLLICFTQFYIELPGAIFLLAALLIGAKSKSINNYITKNNAIFCGFFIGLAFYNYFNYLFFAIPFLIAFIVSPRSYKSNANRIILYGYSFLLGCSFYFIGYTKFYLAKSQMMEYFNLFLVIFYVLLFLGIFIYRFCKGKWVHLYAGLNVFMLLGWAIRVLPAIIENIQSLNVMGTKSTIFGRIYSVLYYFSGVLTGKSGEYLIYQNPVTRFSGLYLWCFIVAIAIVFIMILIRKVPLTFVRRKVMNKKTEIFFPFYRVYLIFFVYLIESILIASRMQTQHMVPMLFIAFILLALSLDIIYKTLNEKLSKIGNYVVVVLFSVCITLNVYNERAVINEIKTTGGVGLYTNQINELSAEAFNNKNSKKELYIFKDWGFMCGFNYLTLNQVPYETLLNTDVWNHYLEEGYELVICFWDKNDTQMYIDLLGKCNTTPDTISITERYGNSGEIAFYVLRTTQAFEVN